MLSHTHAVGGFASLYLLHRLGYVHPGMTDYIVVSAAALLPDVDHSSSVLGKRTKIFSFLKHRGLTHSIPGVLILYYALEFFAKSYYLPLLLFVPYIVLGCASHIILDMLTPSGVALLYPLKKRFKIPLIKTGSKLETIFMFSLIVLIAYFYFEK